MIEPEQYIEEMALCLDGQEGSSVATAAAFAYAMDNEGMKPNDFYAYFLLVNAEYFCKQEGLI